MRQLLDFTPAAAAARIVGILLFLALLPLQGYAENDATAGDWLVEHLLSDPESLNPLTANDYTSSLIRELIFSKIMPLHPKTLEFDPQLVVSRPKISADQLTYTFTLRRDIHFQDGKPLTAHDVLFTLKATKNPWVNAPFHRVYFQSIVSAKLLDDHTIQFSAKEPYFRHERILGGMEVLPRHYYDPQAHLSSLSIQQLDAMNPSSSESTPEQKQAQLFAEQFNKDFSRNPMGSGPYTFQSWKTGQELVFKRDPNYWGMGKDGIDQPYINQRVMRVMNNKDAALVALKAGELDHMGLQPLQHMRQTKSKRFRKAFDKHVFSLPSYTYIGWNNAHPIFQDKRVRQAMTYFTNRQLMVKSILLGLGEIVDSPVFPGRPEYDKTLYSHPFNPAKAKQLLGEAGWTDTDGDGILDKVIDGVNTPFRFEIKFTSGNDVRKSVALTLQDELKKHGIDAQVRQLDWTIYLDQVRNHKFDAIILGWKMPIGASDGYQVWHSSQSANRGSNSISYHNARVDTLLEENRRTFDAQRRTELYQEFQRILNDEQPYTFLFAPKAIRAVHKRFQHVIMYPDGPKQVQWWVPTSLQKFKAASTQ